MQTTLNIAGRILDLSSPKVMAILNVTPDSFYPESRAENDAKIIDCVCKAIESGASLIDVGGCSSRPGSLQVDENEEYRRVSNAFRVIKEHFPDVMLSLDSYRSSVVRRVAVEFGEFLVNDVSGGELDEKMLDVVSEFHLPYVLGHTKGSPKTMMHNALYKDLMAELLAFFSAKIAKAHSLGIFDIVIDPCFGFAKNEDQNIELLAKFRSLLAFGLPVLAGISRKSFVRSISGCSLQESLPATTALNFALLERGASILRVHDTAEAMHAVRLFGRMNEYRQ